MTKTEGNCAGNRAVSIYFADREITGLFAALMDSVGVPVEILSSIEDAPTHTKIITEAKYFPRLSAEQAKRALIVGRKTSLHGISALCLAQPLTEDGVEAALAKFLEL